VHVDRSVLLGLVAGFIGRAVVRNDVLEGTSGPKSWLASIVLGLVGAVVGWLSFTAALGIGDTDMFDWGGILSALIGVVIVLLADQADVAQRRLELAHAAVIEARSGLNGWPVPDARDPFGGLAAGEAERRRGAVGVDEVEQLLGRADTCLVGGYGAGRLERASTTATPARELELPVAAVSAREQPAAGSRRRPAREQPPARPGAGRLRWAAWR